MDDHKHDLNEVGSKIWATPELGFKETYAHEVLTDFLEKHGFNVDRGYAQLPTAFRATFGSGKPNLCIYVYICEYDALPQIDHACGHNLIAEAGVAAGLGVKAALQLPGAPTGTITVMGTPAEEGLMGKVKMIRNGAFDPDDIDVTMIVHPGPANLLRGGYNARGGVTAEFIGQVAHAAGAPWEGRNALDALNVAYTSVAVLRQQMMPTWRVHSIITEGGTVPNIIPDKAVIETWIRALNLTEYVTL